MNQEGNYWNCFARCGGGDISHFWEKWQGVSRGEAIRELRRLCPVNGRGQGTEATR